MLCVASYEKGQEFIRECRRLGCRVLLLTAEKLRDADWPREAIDDIFYLPDNLGREELLKGVSWLAGREVIDRIVALDDFDVEKGALLREHLRVAGMGETTARYFRDKLAMRMRARNRGIRVPDFVHVLNDHAIRDFTVRVPPPWLVKPRSQAAAIGIRKVNSADELQRVIEELGDERSFHLIEKYVPGEIFHVDAITAERTVVFAAAHQYAEPPMDVAHHGGIFVTSTMRWDDDLTEALLRENERLMATLGMVRGVTHTEFIRGNNDGELYFLETSARVGGAFIVEVVEAATGVNLWREWARLEEAGEEGQYEAPPFQRRYAGIVLSLARQATPDTSAYDDAEIVARVRKPHHAGLIVASADRDRVATLLDDYTRRFSDDFYASAPLPDKPSA
ncbi:MAG: ATP-grasp domain-containing protein [Luteitalea sp.]|nr:ATP-grasp domain-containing protein [Luteitalea sp.]